MGVTSSDDDVDGGDGDITGRSCGGGGGVALLVVVVMVVMVIVVFLMIFMIPSYIR